MEGVPDAVSKARRSQTDRGASVPPAIYCDTATINTYPSRPVWVIVRLILNANISAGSSEEVFCTGGTLHDLGSVTAGLKAAGIRRGVAQASEVEVDE